MSKFKNIAFIWEGKNYLMKMKGDASFLAVSEYAKYFNFTTKSDPFLVQASFKHATGAAVGGGAHGLKNLRKQAANPVITINNGV